MPAEIRVALQGFNPFERDALRAFFRLAGERGYALADSIAEARLIVVDADRADALAAVSAAGRGADAVFVGAHAPDGAMARLPRPVDARLILRELDALAGRPAGAAKPAGLVAAPAPPPAPRADDRRLLAVEPLDVLVVDDHDVARRFLGQLVEQLGLRATLAADSREALEQLGRRRHAFVLLDVKLGDASELDGLMLCQRIKRQPAAADGPPPRPPHVVLVSAAAGAAERVLGQLAGCDGYIGKPLDSALLARALVELEPALFGASAGQRRSSSRSRRE